MRAAAVYLDHRGGQWRDGVVSVVGGRVRLHDEQPPAGMPRLDGVVTGGFTDAHVHLQLVDGSRLAASALGQVIDLGGDPDALRRVHNSSESARERAAGAESGRIPPDSEELCAVGDLAVAYAGAFLTPPGGYPSDRAWAPAGSVREVATFQDAASAVAEMHHAGATIIKVASNSTAGPVFSDEMLAAIVDLASTHGKSVIVHAEGQGEAQRATRLRARLLAHAPFSERLNDDELHRMIGSIAWVSTLAIHEGDARDIAIDNTRRFHAMGGNILYGTDMGNGERPVGLDPDEIAALRSAGIDGADLLRALVPVDPLDVASRLNLLPGCTPEDADPLRARPLTPADLEA